MTTHLEVRPGAYHDSVTLMQVSRTVSDVDGVDAALVAMATELNLDFLGPMGFDPDAVDAGPNDLLIAVRATDDDAVAAALSALDAALSASGGDDGGGFGAAPPPRTTAAALARTADADLVLVSTPGEHATVEAFDALRGGANVMVFSDNVPVAAEVALKREASERGLLVMGPDCGTAIVGGVGLGFANVVRAGPVGVVAASGTGAQQLTCLLDDAGIGVTHVLGVGGRDLKAEVGGASTLAALAALDADPATELIVVLSKPPAPEVAKQVRAAADDATTDVVLGLIGPDADDLTEVAHKVSERLGVEPVDPATWLPADSDGPGDSGGSGGEVTAGSFGYGAATAGLATDGGPRGERLRGVFSGGTLATEAMVVMADRLGPIRSNVPLEPGWTVDSDAGDGHQVVDYGEDEYTHGRPHPMIDNSLRVAEIRRAGEDADVGVVLVDVVLGHGAHADPASELAPAITDARDTAASAGRDLAVVVSLCGTEGDPQDRDAQVTALRRAGASVHLSNAAAAREAVRLLGDPHLDGGGS